MKTFIFAVLVSLAGVLPAMAEEQNSSESYLPTEFAGYIVYEGTDHNGERVYVHKPVRYKLYNGNVPADNDNDYEYRNYRMEYERGIKEKEAKEDNHNNINSAANYPIYFDE